MAPKRDTGLLSNVFGFFKSEIGAFVSNATGGTTGLDDDDEDLSECEELPEASGSRIDVNCQNCRHHAQPRRRQRAESTKGDRGSKPPIAPPPPLPSQPTHGALRPRAAPSPERSMARTRVNKDDSPCLRRNSTSAHFSSGGSEVFTDDDGDDGQAQPPRSALRRSKPSTMPGSLFPRSMSLEPGSPLPSDDRHVRFAPGIPSPCKRPPATKAGPSSKLPAAPSSPAPAATARLQRSVSSVRAAVSMFSDDGDPTLLLPGDPSLTGSPMGKGKTASSGSGSGRSRVLADELTDADISLLVSPQRLRTKEIELAAAREEQSRNERRGAATRDRETAEAELERARDKERIRMLEEEIRNLKEELSRRITFEPRAHGSWNGGSLAPLPPPAPPPPPLSFGPISTSADWTSSASDASELFTAARSALRRAPPVVEAPINPGVLGSSHARRVGVAAVNVPSDKMAAFLNEIKTARLRRVSADGPVSSSSAPSRGVETDRLSECPANGRGPSGSDSGQNVRQASRIPLRDHEYVPSMGQKRKRGPFTGIDLTADQYRVVRRRVNSSAHGSNTSTSSNASSRPSTSFSQRSADQTSMSVADTELTTPSLCSDDEDNKEDTSREELLSPISISRQDGGDPRVFPDAARDDMDTSKDNSISDKSMSFRRLNEVMAKRTPSSPMPIDSPRRPRPPRRLFPARNSNSVIVRDGGDSNDDELSLFDSPAKAGAFLSLNPDTEHLVPSRATSVASSNVPSSYASDCAMQRPDSRGSTASTSVLYSRRRQTRGLSVHSEQENDVLMGVGSRSLRRGFLAHGGGGGVPVFMGVGYVEGAIEDAAENGEWLPEPPKRTRSRKVVKRKPRGRSIA